MALRTAHCTTHRGVRYIALPLVALLGTCVACAPASESVEAASSTPSVATNAPAGAGASQLPQQPASQAAAPKAVNGAAQAAEPTASPEPTASEEATVAPLASGSSAGVSVTVLPAETPQLSKETQSLFTAVADSQLKDVRKALKDGADLHATDSAGRTPMMRAVIEGNEGIVKELLEAGSDPNAKDDYQESPFLRASAMGLVPTLNKFLEHRADTRATNRVGGTALSVACENGQVAAVRALLKTDIPVDHVNDLGWTALHETIVLGQGTSNYVTIARLLMMHGANPHLKDQTGSDAFELAEDRQQTQMLRMLRAASN